MEQEAWNVTVSVFFTTILKQNYFKFTFDDKKKKQIDGLTEESLRN